MKKSILVIEDEALIAHDLKDLLEEEGFQVVGPFPSADRALEKLKEKPVDLALLDIHIRGPIDGLHLGCILREEYHVPLIFLSSFTDDKTTARIEQLSPHGYITKPFHPAELLTNIKLALNGQHNGHAAHNGQQNGHYLFVKTKTGLERLHLSDILYLEAFDNFCFVHHRGGRELITHTLKSAEAKLPRAKFMRCHRSFVVNLEKIQAITDDNEIELGESRIPLSRSARSQILKRISLL